MSVQIVLLYEDAATDRFVRRFLSERKFRGRGIQTLPFTSGPAEYWVRKKYPNELRAIRSRQNAASDDKRSGCLVLVEQPLHQVSPARVLVNLVENDACPTGEESRGSIPADFLECDVSISDDALIYS